MKVHVETDHTPLDDHFKIEKGDLQQGTLNCQVYVKLVVLLITMLVLKVPLSYNSPYKITKMIFVVV